MKKLIAKLCIWVLGKLGYENNYSRKNEIIISVDTKDALKGLEALIKATAKVRAELASIKPIPPTV